MPTWAVLTAAPHDGIVADKAVAGKATPLDAPAVFHLARASSAPAAAAVPTLAPGDTARGTLAMGSGATGPLYRLDVAAGQRYTVALASSDVDAFLSLGTLADESAPGAFVAEQTDDDSGGGTDAQIVFTAPADRVYVRAAALGDGETGAFALSLAATPAAAPRPLVAGEPVQGTLAAGDATLDDGSFVDLYTLSATAGDAFEITLASDDFDAYVSVGRGEGEAYEQIAANDDGDGPDDGTHARLLFTAPATGTFVVGANSLGAGETGRYRLRVERR